MKTTLEMKMTLKIEDDFKNDDGLKNEDYLQWGNLLRLQYDHCRTSFCFNFELKLIVCTIRFSWTDEFFISLTLFLVEEGTTSLASDGLKNLKRDIQGQTCRPKMVCQFNFVC